MRVDDAIDAIIVPYHNETLKPWWPAERWLVVAGYDHVELPYQAVAAPPLDMTAEWSLDQLVGYLTTWSGLKAAERAGQNLLPAIAERLAEVVGAIRQTCAPCAGRCSCGSAASEDLRDGAGPRLAPHDRGHGRRPDRSVPAVFPAWTSFGGMPPVLATAFMIGLMELACVEALQAHLAPGERTVGTHVDVSHCAATPAGMTVTAAVTLEAVAGRKLWFHVAAHDQAELIGEGRHQRAIVDRARFMTSAARKARLVA